jgi:hypothetical protein
VSGLALKETEGSSPSDDFQESDTGRDWTPAKIMNRPVTGWSSEFASVLGGTT